MTLLRSENCAADCIQQLLSRSRTSLHSLNSTARNDAKQITKRTILNNKHYLFVSFPRPSATQMMLLLSENCAADCIQQLLSRSRTSLHPLGVYINKLFTARAKSVNNVFWGGSYIHVVLPGFCIAWSHMFEV